MNVRNISLLMLLVAVLILSACDDATTQQPTSASGVKTATVQVPTQSNGLTTEQNQIAGRYEQDNKPGAIKHLYVISAYSGQVILYSTVKGKVTSSGKRLSPTTVAASDGQYVNDEQKGMRFWFPDGWHRTSEVVQDDGTFGSSEPYLYWFDSKGIYHQHYNSGGQIIHISSEPIAVKGVIINLEER